MRELPRRPSGGPAPPDRSEEHTSELHSRPTRRSSDLQPLVRDLLAFGGLGLEHDLEPALQVEAEGRRPGEGEGRDADESAEDRDEDEEVAPHARASAPP